MGQAISRRTFSFGSAAALLSAQTMGQGQAASPSSVTLIEGGIPRPLVIPDQPLDCVVYAARELAAHLAKATGTLPQIIPEHVASGQSTSGGFFFLGDAAIARASIDLSSLAPEACVLRTIGGNFCIAGRDGPGDPLDPDVTAGTLFGVYHFLQNYMKVRWLWPGDLGTMVPKTASLIVPSLDEVVTPHLMQRHVRLFKPGKIDRPELGFSTAAAADYRAEERIFIRRHRMGRRQHIGYGHAFGDWWAKYGDQHPEWFQLVDGRRGPVKPGARFSMSIADPGLHQQIVTLWREKGGARRGASFINAVENDMPGLCECALCRALDSPPPADYLTFIPPQSKMARHPFVTDRYARSWLEIQRLAARDDPDVTVVGYAYFNYFAPPTSGVRLNKNILVGFCPSSWFYPRTAAVQEWMKKQWRGWANTGARIFLRTNHFLDGYCMPFVFAHQFADEFRNAATNGLVGTDFDSLTGQWATQGPTLYLLMRLQSQPDADANALLEEYYACFGPAAADVRAYFEHWENYTMNLSGRLEQTFAELKASRWKSWARAAAIVYPEGSFAAGQKLLSRAAQSAAHDPQAAERVNFLQLGLEHARLCCRAASERSAGGVQKSEAAGQAADALIQFRRTHERTWIANFDHCAWVEGESWN
ncbi:hypothetical protein TomTYG75_15900 [Sphingobium sp. TomTYG75]